MIEFMRLWAFAAAPLPLLAWLVLPRRPARAAVLVPASIWRFMDALPGQAEGRAALLRRRLVLPAIGWLALVAALAGPAVRGQPLLVPTGRDLTVALDVSASMAERRGDDEATGIEQLRAMLGDLIAGRKGDRVALIAFGSDAHLIAPMTFDVDAVAAMLAEVSVGLAGRRTDLGEAIGLTVKVLRDEPAAGRALLVISDGQTNLGDLPALDAAALAAAAGITVHMIGFAAEIDAKSETHMREIATLTGGTFFRARDAADLAAVHERIDGLMPLPAPSQVPALWRDWTWLPLSVALVVIGTICWQEARDP